MTIQEAQEAIKIKGNLIKHKYFAPEEYVYLDNNVLKDEKGLIMSSHFWTGRMCGQWDDGWSLFYFKLNKYKL